MKIASCPELTHRDLEIRHLTASDASDWFEYVSNREAMQFTSSSVSRVDELRARIETANSSEPGTLIHYAIANRSSGRLIGTVGFHTISQPNRSAEITYDVNPTHWGKGIATAACAAATEWAFGELGWVRVQATVLKENMGSIKVLQRCGYELEGTLRSFRIVRGRPCDFQIYSRVRWTD